MQLPELRSRLELVAAALYKPDADRFAERSCAALVPGDAAGEPSAVLPNASRPELTLRAAQPAERQPRAESPQAPKPAGCWVFEEPGPYVGLAGPLPAAG